jgi:serine/threonine-protein kinase RsbT
MAREGAAQEAPSETIVVAITSPADIVTARQRGRELAAQIGFGGSTPTVIATAISELARNIVAYAQQGRIVLSRVQRGTRVGIQIVARDEGPGIRDISKALQDGYSTGRGLGLGLPGVKRLVDDFEVVSAAGKGTIVTARKWIT